MNRSPISRRPLLVGHRGARAVKSIPENTFASYDRALADGCDGFEFDVRLTADGEAVVCHDPEFKGIEIAHTTAPQLAALPRLAEVLARYQERAFLDIELKVPGLEGMAVAMLQRHPPQRGFVVSSFLLEVLQALHELNREIPVGLICETKHQLRWWTRLPVEAVMPQQKLASVALIRQLKAAGKRVFVWTVNDPTVMRRLAASGVDGIISDDTSLLCQTFTP